jgi:hypothetical protein
MPINASLASLSKNGYAGSGNAIVPSTYYYFSASKTNYSDTTSTNGLFSVNGNIYQSITGSSTPSCYPVLSTFNSTGTPSNILNPTPYSFELVSMVVDSSNNTHMLFHVNNGVTSVFLLQEYDTTNTLVYSKEYEYIGAPNGVTIGMNIDSSNNIYVITGEASTNDLFFTKINASTYAVTTSTTVTISGVPTGVLPQSHIIGFYSGYTILSCYSGTHTYIYTVSPTGTVLTGLTFNGVNGGYAFGTMNGTTLYAIIDYNLLIEASYNSLTPSYAYRLGPVVGNVTVDNFSGLAMNSSGTLIAYAESTNEVFLVPINKTTPTSLITPTSYIIANSRSGYTNFGSAIVSNNTNMFVQGSITSGSDLSPFVLKLNTTANTVIEATNINYTLESTTFSTTIESFVRSNITVTSNIANTSSIGSNSFATNTVTVSNVSPATSAITVYNYNQSV